MIAAGSVNQYSRYDANGNRLSHTDDLSAATTSFAYNLDDTIATTTPVGGNGLGSAYSTSGVLQSDGCVQYTADAFDRTQQSQQQAGAPASCGPAPTATTYARVWFLGYACNRGHRFDAAQDVR